MAETRSFVPRDEDDGSDRFYWWVVQCPLHTECSKKSWKHAGCYSYAGADDALAKLRSHLIGSSLHCRSEQDADALLNDAELDCDIETAADREHYRLQVETATSHQVEADDEHVGKGAKGKGKENNGKEQGQGGKGKGKVPPAKKARGGDSDEDNLTKLVDSVARLVDGLTSAASSSSSAAAPLAIVQRPQVLQVQQQQQTVEIPIKSAKILLESFSRAEEAIERAKESAEQVARAARQLDMEASIIDRAKQALKQIIREFGT